jgi:hypothetical protein
MSFVADIFMLVYNFSLKPFNSTIYALVETSTLLKVRN